MSFFKDFKSDITQAMNELMPDGNEVVEDDTVRNKPKKKSVNPLSKSFMPENDLPDVNLDNIDDIAPEDMLDQIDELLDNELYNDGKTPDILLDDDLEVNTMDMSVDDLLNQLSAKQNKNPLPDDKKDDDSLESLLNSISDGDFEGSMVEEHEPIEERKSIENDELGTAILDEIKAAAEEASEEAVIEEVEEEAPEENAIEEIVEEPAEEVLSEEAEEEAPEESATEETAEEPAEEVLAEEAEKEAPEESAIEETAEEPAEEVLSEEAEKEAPEESATEETAEEPAEEVLSEEAEEEAPEESATEEIAEEPAEEVLAEEAEEEAPGESATEETAEEPADLAADVTEITDKENVKDLQIVNQEEKTLADKDVISINSVDEKSSKPEKTVKVTEKVESDRSFNVSDADTETTYITKGTTIKGNLETDGSIDIIGNIEGDVTCQGKVVVGGNVKGNITSGELYANGARIDGDVKSYGSVKVGVGSMIIGNIMGESAVIAGAVNGDIDVKGPVIVDSTAVIMGNIKSRSVQINNGAVIEGFCSQSYSDIDVKSFFA